MRSVKSANELAPFEFSPETLMMALSVFGKRVLEQEMAYAEKYHVHFLRNFYSELMTRCNDNREIRAYIPIGSGYRGTARPSAICSIAPVSMLSAVIFTAIWANSSIPLPAKVSMV